MIMKNPFKLFILLSIFIQLNCYSQFDLQFGDIVFQTSGSSQSEAIQKATHSKYSHVGIVIKNNNELMVLEGVQPVKFTPIHKWISNGEDSKYAVARLKGISFNDSIINLFQNQAQTFLGKNYDLYFDWSDDELYCSELVYKLVYRSLKVEVGKLQQLKEFDLSDPLVKSILYQRFGNNIPLEEKVISPESIYQSDKVEIVFTN